MENASGATCRNNNNGVGKQLAHHEANAETRDRTGDLQIFGLTLSQLSYRGN